MDSFKHPTFTKNSRLLQSKKKSFFLNPNHMNKRIKLLISLAIPILIYILPSYWLPIDHLTTIEHRVISIFILAALFWVFEPIPIFATSVLIIVLELVLISDQSFVLFKPAVNALNYGQIVSYKEIMGTFASPIIMLFLGGFFLALAATKYQLDLNLARVLLKPFGRKPGNLLFGLMLSTALFSMFMSNTATTAMMLAILAPVLSLFETNDSGKIAFVLAVPFAANIGGIGTPIGTPPNAIALKYLTGPNYIGFGKWMLFSIPFVFCLLVFAWRLLLRFFPVQTKELNLEIRSKFRQNWKALTVYFTFGITILLWLTDFLHGMNSYVVAMLPIAVFLTTRIITAEDMKRMSWDVLWLLSGGIALGLALEKSGLAQHLITSIPFENFSPYLIVLAATLITFAMANFMSHTATANLLLPIMAALGMSASSLIGLGGSKMLILAVTFSSSVGMSLPISTPPNAMAHAIGIIESKHMAKSGVLIGLVGLVGIYMLMLILKMVNFL